MAITSPFKKLSHSREGSRDETSTQQQQQQNTHQRKSSKGKPVIQRGGSQTNPSQGLHKKSNTVTSVNSTNSINSTSLAQQYESDKQRLIKYCFSKYDQDGTLSESYITHVRLIEDSSYPSSKPPPTSNPSNKKHRVLALAVQKDGTVRLHKGRENPNGSFQIGRTWSIAELSHLTREPTSDTGFTAKLGKNYYWETNSTKERQVFVTSLVRIYRKFTKGFVPFLINWDLSIFGLDEESYKMFIDKRWLERKESVASVASAPRKQSTTSQVSLPTQPQQQQHRPSVTKYSEPTPVSPKKSADTTEYRSLSPPKRELPSYSERKQQYASDASIPTLNSRRPSEQSSGRSHSKPQLLAATTSSSSGSKDHGLLPAVSTPQLGKTSTSSSSSIPKQPAPDLPIDDDEEDLNATPDDLSKQISKQLDSLALQDDSIPQRRDIDEIPLAKDTSLDSQLKPSSSESAPRSAKDVEIVAHRKSMHEFEQDEGEYDEDEDDSDDEGDITAMYQDAFDEEESKPEPFPGTENPESEPFPGTQRDITPDESYENSFDTGVDSQEVIVQNTPATLKNHSDDGEDYDDLNEVPDTPHLQIPNKTRGARSATVDSAISANIIPGLESEGSSFDDIFDQIDWEPTDDSETLALKLMKELADTEYETTKNLIELKSQSSTLGNYTSKINEECDKLSPLLNFFAVELSGFARDIQHVETESQGLQVETINKKTLWNDLQQLLNTVSVDENSLKILLSSDIDQDLNQIENILADLQSAIVAIRGSDKYEEDLGDMRALKDRRNKYENVLNEFLKKVKYDLDYRFKYAVKRIGDDDDHSVISDQLSKLMVYSGLTLFTKEVSSETFYQLVTIYENSANPLYKNIFDDYNSQLMSSVHQQEKFSLININAFNNVKSTKSQRNLHESKHDRLRQRFGLLDNSNDDVHTVNISSTNGQTEALAIFNVFSKVQSLVTSQQDFILKFFHLSNEDTTLSHYIQLHPPQERPQLLNEKINDIDFDRDNARDIYNSMSSVFQPEFDDLIKTVVQLLRDNQRITPSVILYLELFEKEVGGTNQEFLLTIFKRFIDRLKVDWLKFIENQVKIIDKSVLAHRKVREVSLIVKNFTSFVAEIEKSLIDLLPGYVNLESLEIRTIVNSSYEGLIRAILKNFENEQDEKTFARFKLHDDGDHKEKSNHTVNLIQNSNWLLESLAPYKIVTLEQSAAILKTLFTESRDQYVSHLVHEHFGKIADFVTDVEALVAESPKSIDPSKRNAYSRSALNKILSNYPHSEIAKTVTHLRATVIKHFDGTSNEIQRQLVEKIWSSLQAQFVSITLRLQNITEKYYRDVEARFSKKDLIALFNAARV